MAGTLLRSAVALLLALPPLGSGSVPPPAAAFSVAPGNPAAGSPVQFTDVSSGSPTSWRWDFGDGAISTSQSPTHVYANAGTYPVSLTVGNEIGQTVTTLMLDVSDEQTLRLVASHSFDVSLEAEDPRTGRTGSGKAIPQNNVFGYFTIPDLVPTSGPLVPEVFVKILDATAIGLDYWVFWGGLTDLEYTLTVRENATGATKVYHNPVTESPGCLGADTAGFAGLATPTPEGGSTPTPTATRTRTVSRTATRTSTPTPTPGSGSPILVRLRAIYWQWDFVTGPNTSSTPPYPGVNTITLKRGLTYEFHIYNDGPVLDPPLAPHSFSGIAALGLNAAILQTGGAESVQTITPTETGDFPYLCTLTECGTGQNQHDAMHGLIRVVP